jgi:hypothetical protein
MTNQEVVFGGLVFASLGFSGVICAFLSYQKMKIDALKQGIGGMTNEDREVLRAVQQSILRIEERLEALETLAMEREREEKFGMKL